MRKWTRKRAYIQTEKQTDARTHANNPTALSILQSRKNFSTISNYQLLL